MGACVWELVLECVGVFVSVCDCLGVGVFVSVCECVCVFVCVGHTQSFIMCIVYNVEYVVVMEEMSCGLIV